MNENLEPEQKYHLQKLIEHNSDIFSQHPDDYGYYKDYKHCIRVNGPPVKMGQRPQSPEVRMKLAKDIERLTRLQLIEESNSPYAAIPLYVTKHDNDAQATGTKSEGRLVIDYTMLNTITVDDAFPAANQVECIQELSGAKFISSFDLANGFLQLPIRPEDREKTAFIANNNLYHWILLAS